MNFFQHKAAKVAGRVVDTTANVTARVTGSAIRIAVRAVVTVLLVLAASGLMFACIFAYYVKNNMAPELQVTLEEFSLSQSSTLYYTDTDGNYRELATIYGDQNRRWLEYEELPQEIIQAAVSIEDKRFFEHKGVDWYRTAGAFVSMFLHMDSNFGGSTITQQLIKNTTHEDDVTIQRKLTEIFKALELEKNYTKEEIICWYLNVVYLGEGCYGIDTAAQAYFDKDVSQLTAAECASIIAITNNPSMYDPFIHEENNRTRRETILWEMYDQEYMTHDEYLAAMEESASLRFVMSEHTEAISQTYSWYTEAVLDEVIADLMAAKGVNEDTAWLLLKTGGYKIYTCLDMRIQNIVDDIYENVENLPQSYRTATQQLQSAIVIIQPGTGNVVALSGGTGEKKGNLLFSRATDATRPAGSSIKPLSVYGPALEYGLITQTTEVEDSADVKLSGTSWMPVNSPNTYDGIITIRTALIKSKNTVAAQIVDLMKPETSYEYLVNKLGFTTLVPDDSSYAPMSLGQFTNGVKVIEMAQAYTAIDNDGMMSFARTYTHMTDYYDNLVMDNPTETREVFSANTAHNLVSMLSDAVAYGTGTEARLTGMSCAGKTGTTTDNYDRWFCGFTPYYVAAVWTGYETNEVMYFNGNPAAQIWKSVMSQVHAELENVAFPTCTVGSPTGIFGDLTAEKEREEEEARKAQEEEEARKKAEEEAAQQEQTVTPAPDTPVTEPVSPEFPVISPASQP